MISERELSWILVFVIVLSLAGVVYFAVTPGQSGPQFTEFYVLGPDGNASNYPTNLTVDQTGTIIVGITNHEGQAMEYTLVMQFDDRTVTTEQVTVPSEATRELRLSFTPTTPGTFDLHLLLYTGDSVSSSDEPYRRLRLKVMVHEKA